MKHTSHLPKLIFQGALTVLLVCSAGALALDPDATGSLSMTYHEKNGTRKTSSDFSIIRDKGGYTVSVRSTRDKEPVKEELLCDSAWATLQWHYWCGNNTDIVSKRCGDTLVLAGVQQGKSVMKKLYIDGHPWYQLITMGMQTVSADSAGKSKFWAICLDGPAKLQVAPFNVVAITTGSQPGNPGISCRRVHIRIAGVFNRCWDGYYFIRVDNGGFVYYEGYRLGSKKPMGTIDVVPKG